MGRRSVVGQKIWAPPYYSQHAVFVSPLSAFFIIEGEEEISESLMELMMEAFEMQCHANLQQAIRTVDGLGIEYDENVVCDVCRSVC